MPKNLISKTAFVKDVLIAETGGHCYVDGVLLDDGTVLGISDDCICLYADREAFDNMGDGEVEPLRIIDRPCETF